VVNEVGDVIALITQSKLVEFLYNNRQLYPEVFSTRVDRLQKPVEVINMNEFVIKAFLQIWEKQVSGLAVVNDNGELVGNISNTDLLRTHEKPIGEMIHDLYQPIKQFLNIHTTMQEKVMLADKPEMKPVAVTAQDTIETTASKFLEHKVHRAFIQDDKMKPVGVVTLGDIIQQFV